VTELRKEQHPRLPIFHQHRIHLADGRRVVIAEYGHRAPVPIVYCHGFLGSRLEPLAAGPLDCNIIAVDRPGYGGSAPLPEPSLGRFGEDLAETLDRLGIARCALVGVSAGAPYAMAAALALGPRVTRLVLVAPVAAKRTIREWGGAVMLFRRLRRRTGLLRAVAPRLFRNLRRHGLDARIIRMVLKGEEDSFAPAVDRTHLLRCLVASIREGARGGLVGPLTDIQLLSRRWGIEPARITVPTLVLHGDRDKVVPPAHGRWYAETLPNARAETVAGAKHISLIVNQAERIVRAALAPPEPPAA
jgi:pimeloyl-ACP methyl ester carboxylesterase